MEANAAADDLKDLLDWTLKLEYERLAPSALKAPPTKPGLRPGSDPGERLPGPRGRYDLRRSLGLTPDVGQCGLLQRTHMPPIVRDARRCAITHRSASRHPVAHGTVDEWMAGAMLETCG